MATTYDDNLSYSPSVSWQLFWGALLIACVPMLLAYLKDLWRLEHYQFFPFAIALTGWLAYSRWDKIWKGPRGWFAWALIAGGFTFAALSAWVYSPWIGAVGAIAMVAALFYSHSGTRDLSLFGLVLPLLLILRLPLGFDQLLVLKLQRITTTLSSVVLDLVGLPHAVSNNVIQLSTRELFVAEACSGIQSVFTLMFLAVTIVVMNRRVLWIAPLFILVSNVLAVATNVVRVCVIAMADVWGGIDLTKGWQHELVGYGALTIGILFLLSFDQLIHTLLHPIKADSGGRNPLVRLWNAIVGGEYDEDFEHDHPKHANQSAGAFWRQPVFRIAIFAICIVVGLGSTVQAFRNLSPIAVFGSGDPIYKPDPKIFDGRLQTLSIASHEESTQQDNARLGANADVWMCNIDGSDQGCQFVLSQPYFQWHELCVCYEAGNWTLLNREIHEPSDDEDVAVAAAADTEVEAAYAIARFSRPGGQHAYLLYSAMDADGAIVRPPPLAGALGNRLQIFDKSHGDVMMVQLFSVTDGRADKEVLAGLRKDFLAMRAELVSKIKADLP